MAPFRESIRFTAHCNFVQTEDGPMPVEIAFGYSLGTVDNDEADPNKNRRCIGRSMQPLPFGYPGKYTYKKAIAQVWERYTEKDKGLGWWVAVIGDTQQNFSSIVVYLSWTLICFGTVPSTKSYPLQIGHF
ncbi:hypothetical protein CEXT_782881 [Caerostris extrusa]|uniref:Uncharacterized protein n=1 Tax=Caerostris extrusa TaxID=172846 RepID=A0AAV4RUS7_CAEEX|nr:hypothetical protein CEXT_782881 [Caerostris extrusa]